MRVTSEKPSKRELQKLRESRRRKPDPMEDVVEVIELADGTRLMRRSAVIIPGYTYSM